MNNELECSAALPTMGMMTNPMNTVDQPSCPVTGLMVPTNNSLFQAMPMVATSNITTANHSFGGFRISTSCGLTPPVTASTSSDCSSCSCAGEGRRMV